MLSSLVIKTNVSQVTDVTIRDMGIIIPNSGGSETLSGVNEITRAYLSSNLRTLTTDNAFGVNSSTIILNNGSFNIAQTDVLTFINAFNGSNIVSQTTVDFGFPTSNEGDLASITFSASWVTSTTRIDCIAVGGTANHDVDDVSAEGINSYVTNVVAGTSFDVVAYAPNGSWGQYFVNITAQI